MVNALHHANDISPGLAGLEALNKADALNQMKEMFHGNPNITAMYASQLNIPGAPKMPDISLLQSSDPSVIEYNQKINEYGELLKGNPELRNDITQQMLDKLDGGSLGNKITLQPGYLSTGSNNSLSQYIYGTRPSIDGQTNQVFVDPEVWYNDADAVEWHLSDGTTILVEPHCGQIAYQPPVHVSAPAAVYQPTPSHNSPLPTPDSPPPSHSTPPGTPDIPGTPDTPDTPGTPDNPDNPNPPADAPKTDDFELPDGFVPRPAHTEPAGPPIDVQQTAPAPAPAPNRVDLPPPPTDSSSNAPGSASGIQLDTPAPDVQPTGPVGNAGNSGVTNGDPLA